MLLFFSILFLLIGIGLGMFIQYTVPGAFGGIAAGIKAIIASFKKKK